MSHELLTTTPFMNLPPALAAASPKAFEAIVQFFAAEIRNPNTRRAYIKAAEDFFGFAASARGGDRLETITSLHLSSWLETMRAAGLSAPTIKARLAGLKMLFQALARERVLDVNPAAVVRGPKHSVRRGKTPVLSAEEARQLLDCINTETLVGLRDRALIATMVYSFGRIGAVTGLRVQDVFTQQRRLWIRLNEKGGKRHEVPCHHQLENYLDAYLQASGLHDQPKAPLFQTFDREGARKETGWRLSGKPVSQAIAWQMLQRRARDAGLDTELCNHTFRATGITTYLKNGGTLERAANMACHASTRTTQLYDRRPDDVTLDEIEKIQI
jgi:site-specific recombinase XerD